MAIRIKSFEWKILYTLTGIIDGLQLAFCWTGVEEVVSEIVDIIVGILLVIYFQLRGVSMFKRINRLLSMLGITIVEEITGGIAPTWIMDIYYMQKSVAEELAEQEPTIPQPGITPPRPQRLSPLNQNGSRLPRKI